MNQLIKRMKTYKIPVSWEVYDTVDIKAKSLKEAIAIFDRNADDIPLGHDWTYVEGSYKREQDMKLIKELNVDYTKIKIE